MQIRCHIPPPLAQALQRQSIASKAPRLGAASTALVCPLHGHAQNQRSDVHHHLKTLFDRIDRVLFLFDASSLLGISGLAVRIDRHLHQLAC